MILIAAIRDYFHRVGDSTTASSIERDHLFTQDRRTHEVLPKLHLNTEDHEFFLGHILSAPNDSRRKSSKKNKPQKSSHRRMLAAAEIAAEQVKKVVAPLSGADGANQLHNWLDFLNKGARVIWVQVSDERTAYFIFETMNDRGLKLSAADLLKNRILSQANDRRDEAFQKWSGMAAILDTLDENEDAVVNYIRYLWIANNGPVRSRDLYDKISATIKNKTSAINFASELEERASDYAAILTSSHEAWASYDPDVRKQIDTLLHLGVKQLRPLLLSALKRFSPKEMVKLFAACVCWSVRFLIAGVTPGSLENPHGRSAERIAKGEINKVEELFSALRPIIPDDERFRAAVANANVAQAHLARYYLRAMQGEADGEKEPQYVVSDGRGVTLEHILPENPGENWPGIDAEMARVSVNRLGNQVLLPGAVNSKLGNASFAVKRPALLAAKLSLTVDAGKSDKWNAEAIASRQQFLAELAIRTWPLKPWV